METANAARAPPNASRGMLYIFTLKADTAKMLREMPAEAHAGVGASGIIAVAIEIAPAARHTRNRAFSAATPRSIRYSESHPPAAPPAAAKTGGIHAYQAAWTSVSP